MKIVSFLSDFGLSDSYVGEVKAVLGAAKGVTVVDLTHLVPAHANEWGAFQLLRAYRHFPKGTIHLAIVDPGVGSARRAVCVRTKDHTFVGPDNCLLLWAVQDAERRDKRKAVVSEIAVPAGISPTFHGRDVFAPFVLKLLKGAKPKAAKAPLVGRGLPASEILVVDHYGNCISSVPWTPREATAEIRGRKLRSAASYSAIPEGEAALIRGSSGFWEIACHGASAAQRLGVKPGTPLTVLTL